VPAEQEGSAIVAIGGVDLTEILCVQEERQVGHDNTVVFHKRRLQIPPSPLRAHFVRATVKVRQYLDGSHAIFHGPACIARYDAGGALQTASPGLDTRCRHRASAETETGRTACVLYVMPSPCQTPNRIPAAR
jgi:hypothetical protein